MKVTNYIVEIFQPGSNTDIWVSFSSDAPFQAISTGDYISPAFTYSQNQKEPDFKAKDGSGLVVSKVEHLIASNDGESISHKLSVFTTEADNPRF
jgi:hypothetical protein